MMFEKQIVPIPVLNDFATEFIGEFVIMANDSASRMIEIEFYNKDGFPLLSRRGKVTGLPVNADILQPIEDYMSVEVQDMFSAQNIIIFDEIQRALGLTYYDETFQIKPERIFSYRTFITLGTERSTTGPYSFHLCPKNEPIT